MPFTGALQVHLMAESWGLMHESVGEGSRRRLVVWKPSSSRRSLKPGRLEGRLSSDPSDAEEDNEGESSAAPGP